MKSGNSIWRTTWVKFFPALLVFSFQLAYSSDPKFLFERGNKLYRTGEYEKAATVFEQVVKEGQQSVALYYNLGNAYYKQDDYARAILNYERALKLSPQDEDILFNLRLANMNTVDKIEPLPKLFYQQWWESFITLFNEDTWSKIGLAFLWTALLFAVFFILARTIALKKAAFFGTMFFLLTGIFVLTSAFILHQRLHNQKAAIIMETNAYVKSSPEEKSTNLFMLHAGTKIEIADELQGWKKIKIANGNVGWVKNETIEVI